MTEVLIAILGALCGLLGGFLLARHPTLPTQTQKPTSGPLDPFSKPEPKNAEIKKDAADSDARRLALDRLRAKYRAKRANRDNGDSSDP